MKLIEHLEYILRLIEDKATLDTIKGAVVAMHEEAQGHDAALEKVTKLADEHSQEKLRLQNQINQFVAISKAKPPHYGGPPFIGPV